MLRQALYIPLYLQDIFSVKAATASGATGIFKEGKDVLQDREGRRPNISRIQKFGSVCYAYKQDKRKLDSRCEKGIFVGYDKNSPAYMVYYPDNGKVQKHRLVKFVTKTIEEQQTQTDMTPGDDDFEVQNGDSKTRQDTGVSPGCTQGQVPVTRPEVNSQAQTGEISHEPTRYSSRQLIQESIVDDITKAGMFSVQIDTTQDITSQDQCSVVR
ncbi:hypothetical protein AAFF_G00052280 [Aldrovandia affinis]|uniref:Retroviral polymerase SH3-like domain-containing protein n=1 Tax=Aldrovandia affinis TaxID=143900 RepID=A0AAD7WZ75_9TELE|nr:hypothetical protein AAFF_G00052280 [Aldrovandia affinis]